MVKRMDLIWNPAANSWCSRLTLANGREMDWVLKGGRKAGKYTLFPQARKAAYGCGLKLVRGCPVYLEGVRV